MKTIIKPIIVLAIIVVGFISLFTNCKKDTDCIVVITVRKQSDTNIIVPNTNILLYQGNVNVPGVTDMNGQFRYTFSLPAILQVSATYNGTPDTLKGSAVIQLIVGGTAYKTVFVQ
jgi:hypothetical protein